MRSAVSEHHDKYSPSKLHQWDGCPHWESQGSGPEAQRGTRIHAAVANGNLSLLQDADEVLAAKRCLAYLTEIKVSAPNYGFTQETWVDGAISETGGTLDLVGIHSSIKRGIIIDWKGSDIDPLSLQGKAYALNLMKKYNLDSVAVAFFNYTSGRLGDFAVYDSQAQLAHDVATVKERRISVEMCPSSHPRNPNSGCAWCSKKSACKEASEVTTKELTVIADEDAVLDMSTQQASMIYAKLTQVMKRAKKIEDALKERLIAETEAGVATGYRVSTKGGQRQWTDNSIIKQATEYAEGQFLEAPDFYELKSPAEMERELILSFGASHTEHIQEMIASAVTQSKYKTLTKEK